MSNENFPSSMAGGYNTQKPMEVPSHISRLAVMYPSGNLTAVVFDDVLDAPRKELQNKIEHGWGVQHPGEPEIEQCCFVITPHDSRAIARMEMFGGEFCGNATRSVIQLITGGKDSSGMIEASGADRPLNFSVEDRVITLEMPLLKSGEQTKEVDEGTLVYLDGITHLVVTDKQRLHRKTAREVLEEFLEEDKYGVAEAPSFGVTYYDKDTDQADFAVRVKKVDSIYDETACGSGTCAIGAVMALAAGKEVELKVIQPSGEAITTTARVDSDSIVTASSISGAVTSLYDGEFDLPSIADQ